MSIQELELNTQNLINASYQLDSPLAIAKELLDNSIDAGATEIEIQVFNDKVLCIDNGKGFSGELMQNIFKNKVTTKQNGSFGFRGEALFMINQLAKIQIESKGVKYDRGELLTTNMQKTVITVWDVFYNLPVRKAFYQLQMNFNNAVKQKLKLFEAYAIIFNVNIKLLIQDQVRFNTFGRETPIERFRAIFMNYLDQCVELSIEEQNYQVHGFLSSCQETQRVQHLFVFVNEQYVQNVELYQSINNAYQKFNAINKASGFVNIKVPEKRVDFNCSNDKMTIKLMGVQAIIESIQLTFSQKLQQKMHQFISYSQGKEIDQQKTATATQQVKFEGPALSASPQISKQSVNKAQFLQPQVNRFINLKQQLKSFSQLPGGSDKQKSESLSSSAIFAATQLNPMQIDAASESQIFVSQEMKDSMVQEPVQKSAEVNESDEIFMYAQSSSDTEEDQAEQPYSQNVFDCNYIGQYNKSFLITSRNDQLFLIDQHALNEAVLYEKIVNSELNSIKVQPLIQQQRLTLSPHQEQVFKLQNAQFYKRFGFAVNIEQLLITGVPIFDGKPLSTQDFIDFIDDLDTLDDQIIIPRTLKAIFANRACKSAIKLGDAISDAQARQLLLEAKGSKNVMNCPHGRKVIFRIK